MVQGCLATMPPGPLPCQHAHTFSSALPPASDAIRALGAVRVENNQLRQLNKFLEVRLPLPASLLG